MSGYFRLSQDTSAISGYFRLGQGMSSFVRFMLVVRLGLLG